MISFNIEKSYQGLVGGVDEVGRGPLAGPVVACAVVFKKYDLPQEFLVLIQDSKKLSIKKRETAYKMLIENNGHWLDYAIARQSPADIDQLNILQASLKAMQNAIEALPVQPDHILVDGNKKIPTYTSSQTPIIKGDSISYSIAAASIIAKVIRDKIMQELSLDYPHYGWEKNAGYPTKKHIEALLEYGISPHHRKSFAPVKAFCV